MKRAVKTVKRIFGKKNRSKSNKSLDATVASATSEVKGTATAVKSVTSSPEASNVERIKEIVEEVAEKSTAEVESEPPVIARSSSDVSTSSKKSTKQRVSDLFSSKPKEAKEDTIPATDDTEESSALASEDQNTAILNLDVVSIARSASVAHETILEQPDEDVSTVPEVEDVKSTGSSIMGQLSAKLGLSKSKETSVSGKEINAAEEIKGEASTAENPSNIIEIASNESALSIKPSKSGVSAASNKSRSSATSDKSGVSTVSKKSGVSAVSKKSLIVEKDIDAPTTGDEVPSSPSMMEMLSASFGFSKSKDQTVAAEEEVAAEETEEVSAPENPADLVVNAIKSALSISPSKSGVSVASKRSTASKSARSIKPSESEVSVATNKSTTSKASKSGLSVKPSKSEVSVATNKSTTSKASKSGLSVKPSKSEVSVATNKSTTSKASKSTNSKTSKSGLSIKVSVATNKSTTSKASKSGLSVKPSKSEVSVATNKSTTSKASKSGLSVKPSKSEVSVATNKSTTSKASKSTNSKTSKSGLSIKPSKSEVSVATNKSTTSKASKSAISLKRTQSEVSAASNKSASSKTSKSTPSVTANKSEVSVATNKSTALKASKSASSTKQTKSGFSSASMSEMGEAFVKSLSVKSLMSVLSTPKDEEEEDDDIQLTKTVTFSDEIEMSSAAGGLSTRAMSMFEAASEDYSASTNDSKKTGLVKYMSHTGIGERGFEVLIRDYVRFSKKYFPDTSADEEAVCKAALEIISKESSEQEGMLLETKSEVSAVSNNSEPSEASKSSLSVKPSKSEVSAATNKSTTSMASKSAISLKRIKSELSTGSKRSASSKTSKSALSVQPSKSEVSDATNKSTTSRASKRAISLKPTTSEVSAASNQSVSSKTSRSALSVKNNDNAVEDEREQSFAEVAEDEREQPQDEFVEDEREQPENVAAEKDDIADDSSYQRMLEDAERLTYNISVLEAKLSKQMSMSKDEDEQRSLGQMASDISAMEEIISLRVSSSKDVKDKKKKPVLEKIASDSTEISTVQSKTATVTSPRSALSMALSNLSAKLSVAMTSE